MKQLTAFEIEEIAGGYSWDFSLFDNALKAMAGNMVELAASVAVAASAGGMAGYGYLYLRSFRHCFE